MQSVLIERERERAGLLGVWFYINIEYIGTQKPKRIQLNLGQTLFYMIKENLKKSETKVLNLKYFADQTYAALSI